MVQVIDERLICNEGILSNKTDVCHWKTCKNMVFVHIRSILCQWQACLPNQLRMINLVGFKCCTSTEHIIHLP